MVQCPLRPDLDGPSCGCLLIPETLRAAAKKDKRRLRGVFAFRVVEGNVEESLKLQSRHALR
eukprot:6383520-Heterocapsa_arctica.AAC.1